jgi:hypothetical protein
MVKLELKHLEPYLPYGLKTKTSKTISILIGVDKTSIIEYLDTCRVKLDRTLSAYFPIQSIKPILRPLSDLVKEIEVDGEKFIPITELRCIEQGNWDEDVFLKDHTQIIDYGIRKAEYESDCYWIEWKDGITQTQILSFKDNDFSRIWKEKMMGVGVNNQLMLFNKLYEWHFDVFRLIEKGLAIDINKCK